MVLHSELAIFLVTSHQGKNQSIPVWTVFLKFLWIALHVTYENYLNLNNKFTATITTTSDWPSTSFRLSNVNDKRTPLVRMIKFRTVIKLFVPMTPLPYSFSSDLCIQLVQSSICHLVHQSCSKLAFLFHLFECRLSNSRYLFLSCDTKTVHK